MKRIISILVLAWIILPTYSQELSKREQRQLQKELKQEQRAQETAQKSAIVEAMVFYQRFVLEANTLRDRRGNSVNVSSTINFVAADSLTGVIQVGSNTYIGRNGVGGVTLEGSISDYKYTKNERSGSYNITYLLRTPLGTYDVRITSFSDGRADAEVSSTTWSNRIRYSGYLVPPATSRVFKGSSL